MILNGVNTMADVKTLTIHGTTYDIKDENARNSISTLQSTVSGHTSDISGLETDVSALQGTVSGHTSDISGLETDVSALQGTVSGHTSDISGLESEVSALQGTVSGHTSDISGLESEVSSLQGTVSGHTSDISSIESSLTHTVYGEWFFNNTIPQTDTQISEMAPNMHLIDLGSFTVEEAGDFGVVVSGIQLTNGTNNTEIFISVNGTTTLIATSPNREDITNITGLGIVHINTGVNSIKVGLRKTGGETSPVLKAYNAIFAILFKVEK